MVCPDLAFEAVHGLGRWHHHDARVVHQDVGALHGVGEGAHRRQIGHVDLTHLGASLDRSLGGVALLGVAHRHDDVRAHTRELACGLQAESAVGSGDDDGAALE
ncbi:Uncharacterised protein [Mycobacteroides abscessus subsp. massiliense]|nr:Uncharacterised protein [Mycobacteroides abscessus subsp. massiliense]